MPSILSLMDQAQKEVGKWADEIQDGVPLSPSAIFTFKKCGLQFWFRYIKKIKEPPRAAWSWGGAGHAVIATDLEVKRKTGGTACPEAPLVQMFEATFEERYRDVERHQKLKGVGAMNERDDLMDKGRRLIKLFKTREPELHPHPTRIEHKLVYPLEIPGADNQPENVLITNHIDLITTDGLVDHKWKSRTPPTPTTSPLQLVSYALAYQYNFGKLPVEVRRDDYVALKSKVTIIPQILTAESIDKQARTSIMLDVHQIVRASAAGLFHLPERGVYPCTDGWCGYWNRCPYGGNGTKAPKSALVEIEPYDVIRALKDAVAKKETPYGGEPEKGLT